MPERPKPLTRRNSIQGGFTQAAGMLAGGVATAMGVARIDLPSRVLDHYTVRVLPPLSDKERQTLTESGLMDFAGLYGQYRAMHSKYGSAGEFYHMLGTLERVVTGQVGVNSSEAAQLRDGWGEKAGQLDSDTGRKISNLGITTAPGVMDSIDGIRHFLTTVARVFPHHIMALPNHLHVWPGGGNAGDDLINIESPTKGGENAYITLLHEGGHELHGRWFAHRPYIQKDKMIQYVSMYLQTIEAIADSYYSSPLDEALRFKNGQMLVGFIPTETEALAKWDQANPLSAWEVELPGYTIDPKDRFQNRDYRLNKMIHYAGSQLFASSQKGDLTQDEQYIASHPLIKRLASMGLAEIGHFLIGPVQKKGGGRLAASIAELPEDGLVITVYNLAIQAQRLALFSRLNVNATLADLREALGLKPVTELETSTPTPKKIEYEYTAEQPETYGATLVGEYQIDRETKYKLYELPPNPLTPEKKGLLLRFVPSRNSRTEYGYGLYLNVPKQYKLEPKLWEQTARDVPKKTPYSPDVQEGVAFVLVSPEKQISISMEKGWSGNRNYSDRARFPFPNDLLDQLFEFEGDFESIYDKPKDEYLRLRSVVSMDLVKQGSNDQNPDQDSYALWMDDRGDPKLYPLPTRYVCDGLYSCLVFNSSYHGLILTNIEAPGREPISVTLQESPVFIFRRFNNEAKKRIQQQDDIRLYGDTAFRIDPSTKPDIDRMDEVIQQERLEWIGGFPPKDASRKEVVYSLTPDTRAVLPIPSMRFYLSYRIKKESGGFDYFQIPMDFRTPYQRLR